MVTQKIGIIGCGNMGGAILSFRRCGNRNMHFPDHRFIPSCCSKSRVLLGHSLLVGVFGVRPDGNGRFNYYSKFAGVIFVRSFFFLFVLDD